MANKVTQEDVKNFNELYIKYHTYAEVARQTGFSPTTVKKYIIKDYVPDNKIEKKLYENPELPPINMEPFLDNDWFYICELSDEEKEGIKELWKEMVF